MQTSDLFSALVTIRVPSGLNLVFPPPGRLSSSFPVSASHTRAVQSLLAVSIRLPSALQSTIKTSPVCPLSTVRVQACVSGLVDDPHAAAGDLPDDLVPRNFA